MDQWSVFLQERWFILAIGVVVLLLIVKLVKTVIKWVLVLALLAGLFFYGASYKDKLAEMTGTLGEAVASGVKDQAMSAIASEAKEAKYKANADGTFTVTTKNIQVDAAPGANEAKITFLGQSFTMKMDDALRAFIEQAKSK
ncbi:hypothetical protein J31TS4_40290 [Paenibacillus sp. J31TS4]|uniref:hypothetical protein n=1 Tax=Paenibacillus sp. J31TS4 TaxID=2807195 RepID=UPI001B15228F|nr:hypothetical protein [Paenibacillus sp. J31TS4]GIP40749.1 hypothetical protein J31TS4_40290 [Paenibacillus sp. J31TS4]